MPYNRKRAGLEMDDGNTAIVLVVDEVERLAFALVAITSLAIHDGLGGRQLTFAQWRVLVVLGDGPLRLRDLASRLMTTASAASRLVDRLTEKGVVAVSPDDTDRRGLFVSLTDVGRAMRDAVVARRRITIREALSRTDIGDADSGVLRAIADALGPWG